MNSKSVSSFGKLAVAGGCALGLVGGAWGAAVPAGTATFAGGNCTATFVRSASDIVNVTDIACQGTSAEVYLQFRPLSSKPDARCNPFGLVTSQGPFQNTEESLARWFRDDVFTACVYLVNPVVAQGSFGASDLDGANTAAVPLSGSYAVCVGGTWTNKFGAEVMDAEYMSQDGWATYSDGRPAGDPFALLGPNFADVQIDGQFVDWGAYNASHVYCVPRTKAAGGSFNLGVFDGDGNANVKVPLWYLDNGGTLGYAVVYVGQ
ncbi:MAG TPA: hypothetical protein VFP36_05435 [Usitatibacter sp.]|nr:hypothetical protein [Usitatibacter sp.]